MNLSTTKADHIRWHDHSVQRERRASQKGQKPCMIWFTGLSGAGKSTVANVLDCLLFERGRHTYLLDGDNVRHGLNRDLGFSDTDRVENIRRIGEVGKLFVDAGLITLSAFISPFRSDRQMVRTLFPVGEFIEVYVSTPLEVCEQRDPKGLYQKARQGIIRNFTGIDSAYEPPMDPELEINTGALSVDQAVQCIYDYLQGNGYV
jgi:adenylylsulfate kinase